MMQSVRCYGGILRAVRDGDSRTLTAGAHGGSSRAKRIPSEISRACSEQSCPGSIEICSLSVKIRHVPLFPAIKQSEN